jgi:hypothetical protein
MGEPSGDPMSYRGCIFLFSKFMLESPVTGGFMIGNRRAAARYILILIVAEKGARNNENTRMDLSYFQCSDAGVVDWGPKSTSENGVGRIDHIGCIIVGTWGD